MCITRWWGTWYFSLSEGCSKDVTLTGASTVSQEYTMSMPNATSGRWSRGYELVMTDGMENFVMSSAAVYFVHRLSLRCIAAVSH